MESFLEPHEPRASEALIREMERSQGNVCPDCGAVLCSHLILINSFMGFKNHPRCVACLVAVLAQDEAAFRDGVIDSMLQRECYRAAWNWANRNEAGGADSVLACPAAARRSSAAKNDAAQVKVAEEDPASAFFRPSEDVQKLEPHGSTRVASSVEWDAGDMGCGDLVLELRLRLQSMEPGQIMKLRATDLGAPEDLPAWCRLTGHTLLRAQHPHYWIERKE